MIAWLLEILRHVPFINVLANTHISIEGVIGLPQHMKGITSWRSEELRMMASDKFFEAPKIANGLKPWGIGLVREWQLRSKDHRPQETVLKVKDHTM